jgi:hypothetical protein
MKCCKCGEHTFLDDGTFEIALTESLKQIETLKAKLEELQEDLMIQKAIGVAFVKVESKLEKKLEIATKALKIISEKADNPDCVFACITKTAFAKHALAEIESGK